MLCDLRSLRKNVLVLCNHGGPTMPSPTGAEPPPLLPLDYIDVVRRERQPRVDLWVVGEVSLAESSEPRAPGAASLGKCGEQVRLASPSSWRSNAWTWLDEIRPLPS